eukprot:4214150-Lingulodinium_polyedra.AAC.1
MVSLASGMHMSGALLARSDGIEVARGSYEATKWPGGHFIGQIPEPEDQPEGAVYRAKDLERPERREHVRFAFRAKQVAIFSGAEHYTCEDDGGMCTFATRQAFAQVVNLLGARVAPRVVYFVARQW